MTIHFSPISARLRSLREAQSYRRWTRRSSLWVVFFVFVQFAAPNVTVAAQVSQAKDPNAGETSCPKNTVCLVIEDFVGLTSDPEMDRVFGRAIPEAIHIALLAYRDIQPVSRNALWRTLQASGVTLDEMTPNSVFKPSNLRKAGANFVLHGRFLEIEGTVQLSGRIESLTHTWREVVQGDVVPQDDIFSAVTSFAAEVMRTFSDARILRYKGRKFVMTLFCDESPVSTPRSEFYVTDLPAGLATRADSIKIVEMTALLDKQNQCPSTEEALTLAKKEQADAVVTGRVQLDGDELWIETKLFLPQYIIWLTVPTAQNSGATYLEQKSQLLNQFQEYLKALLTAEGEWNINLVKTVRNFQALLKQAIESAGIGDLDTADVILAEALKMYPSSAEAHQRLGEVRYQQGRYEEAVDEHREAIRLEVDFPEAYKALGDAYVKLREFQNAEKAYQDLLGLTPDSVEALHVLGDVNLFEERYDKTEGYYLEAAKQAPPQAESYVKLATMANIMGDLDKAIEWLEKGLKIDPDHRTARSRLVDFLSDQGQRHKWKSQYRNAYEKFDLAIQYAPSPSPHLFFRRANVFMSALASGQIQADSGYDPAIDDFSKARQLQMSNGEPDKNWIIAASSLNLQELLVLSGKYDDAIRVGKEFLNLNDDKSDYRAPARKLMVHFNILFALILANKPSYERELASLQEQIASSDAIRYNYAFASIAQHLEKRSASITKDQREIIINLIDKLKAIFGG